VGADVSISNAGVKWLVCKQGHARVGKMWALMAPYEGHESKGSH